MKAFLEEYGLIIVAILVILVFVLFASVFGGGIKDNITEMMTNLFDKTTSEVVRTGIMLG